jgi:ribonuclease BN (tRNA processing enzyme)
MDRNSSTLRVAGCSGSAGNPNNGTSCFVLNDTVLVDAGTGLLSLSLDEISNIDHVVITHSHHDHIAGLPFLIEIRQHFKKFPLKIYGSAHTLGGLKNHIFNFVVWPDFTVIPNPQNPAMEYIEIGPDHPFELAGVRFSAVHTQHTVPTLGFILKSETGCLAFAGDTKNIDSVLELAGALQINLDHVIAEVSMSNACEELAITTGHLTPRMIESQIQDLSKNVTVWLGFLKEWQRPKIETEMRHIQADCAVRMMERDWVFEF